MGNSGFVPPLSIVAGLLGLQAAYLLCTGPYRDRFRGSVPVPLVRQVLFAQGIVVLFVALVSPLGVLSDRYLFTAHMVQHLLITLVAAPLLLAGTPGWLLEDLLRTLGLVRAARWALHPLIAFGAFNLVFGLAHLPALYELALSSEPLHAAEHLLFLGSALVMWMPILSPLPGLLPRYPYIAQLLYLFAQTVPSALVGALVSGASQPLYPTYALAPRVLELTPLADQQLGGLIMWVGGGVYFLVATGIVFFVWASREEAADARPAGARGA
jgi:cytochrome c oxidase assembly factor CtaG